MGLDETLTKNILIFGSNSNLQILNEERERRRIGVMVTLMLLAVTGLAAADRLDVEKARLERNQQTVASFYTTFMTARSWSTGM